MKILILGNGRHGKDTLGELFNKYFGLTFMSSSQAYGYTTSEECFEDRVNHREEWYQSICDYNKDNRARLAQDILSRSDCYVGMRDKEEFKECVKQKLFDIIIWVDASKRLPLEPGTSFNINMSDADIIVENNGTFEEFVEKSKRIGKALFGNDQDVVWDGV